MIFWRLYVETVSYFAMDGPHVTVAQGELLGKLVETPSGQYYSFQGVPYAKPPLGSLRFKAPLEAEPWTGVRDATIEGNSCSQINFYTNEYEGGEDCLYLNIYTSTLPNIDDNLPANKPVIVFAHGGGYMNGSGNSDILGPDYLVAEDVILVTINYRIGPLGFLCLHLKDAPGNAGIRDQIQALKWVKENIEKFGGDSDNITFAGQSSGAASAAQLTTTPLADGLFNKILLASATPFNEWTIEERPLNRAYNLSRSLGCESNDVEEVLAFLHTVTAEELIKHSDKLYHDEDKLVSPFSHFAPVVEKVHEGVEPVFITHPAELIKSGAFRRLPVMIGYNSIESARHFYSIASEKGLRDDFQDLIPREFGVDVNSSESIEIWHKIKHFYFGEKHIGAETTKETVDLTTDTLFSVGISRYVDAIINNGNQPVFFYKFDYFGANHIHANFLKSVGLIGAAHPDDLPYIFKVSIFDTPKEMNVADARVKERFVFFWTNFAKYSNPTPSESELTSSTWLPATKTNKYYMDINHEIVLGTEPDKERIDFWNELYDKYASSAVQHSIKDGPPKVLMIERDAASKDEVEDVKLVDDAVESVAVDDAVESVAVADAVEAGSDETSKKEQIETDDEVKRAEPVQVKVEGYNGQVNHHVQFSNGVDSMSKANDIIRANDPPEDDLPKNIGVNKFINFFEKLGTKK